ncbi:unnamed protein product [Protopolystoma xenopodis]|uniref:Uncharacterized protein n=1 Tax=Protopolystoma xenopodis TaxID=117903 RepID=A0A448X681_9PLAT|nr:unnamed protein product [Protopolystoma xenopodis]
MGSRCLVVYMSSCANELSPSSQSFLKPPLLGLSKVPMFLRMGESLQIYFSVKDGSSLLLKTQIGRSQFCQSNEL